jgi:hypothetical protein
MRNCHLYQQQGNKLKNPRPGVLSFKRISQPTQFPHVWLSTKRIPIDLIIKTGSACHLSRQHSWLVFVCLYEYYVVHVSTSQVISGRLHCACDY